MSLYSYMCCQCGVEDVDNMYSGIGSYHPNLVCPVCGGRMKRRVSFSFRRSMPEHFNHSVGSYVSNTRQFADQLKIKSEEASIRTGMDHNFVPVDVTDRKALGVTDEGLEDTHRRHKDEGNPRAISQRESKTIPLG